MRPRRPGWLWLFFYGRRRRGFPGLLVGLIAASIVLALLYAAPGGVDFSRWFLVLSVAVLALLILGSLALVALAALRGPFGRRSRGQRRDRR